MTEAQDRMAARRETQARFKEMRKQGLLPKRKRVTVKSVCWTFALAFVCLWAWAAIFKEPPGCCIRPGQPCQVTDSCQDIQMDMYP